MAIGNAAIGIDVGGTHVRAARIDSAGTILERVVEPVICDRSGFAYQLLRLIRRVQKGSCNGVGVGIPGRVDAARGETKSAGYLDIAGLDLPKLIAEGTGLRSRIENDATMALLAEAHTRQEQGLSVVAMVTIGTGIGGGILCNGLPWYGGGFSGQFGHIVVAEGGPRCNCGRQGCVETFSSGTALGQLVQEAGLPDGILVEELLKRASQGDSRAISILQHWARPLRRALDTVVSVIDPELIVIGGGLGTSMVQALKSFPNESDWFEVRIEAAFFGDDAGVIGAGLCGMREYAR